MSKKDFMYLNRIESDIVIESQAKPIISSRTDDKKKN
jgi:hypothetical protein